MLNSAQFILLLAKCGNIVNQIDASISIHIDLYPAIEGTNVTFSCPHGLVLNGPNTSTCMRNGEWEPDSQNLTCLGD